MSVLENKVNETLIDLNIDTNTISVNVNNETSYRESNQIDFIITGESRGESTQMTEETCNQTIKENTIKHPSSSMKDIKAQNENKLIIAHLNINFLVNKFKPLEEIIKNKVDIMMVSETKIDDSFPLTQFEIEGYIQYRRDRDSQGGGIIIYIREEIPSREIELQSNPEDLETLFIEINIRKTKWLLIAGYNPKKENISYFLNHVGVEIDKLLVNYGNIFMLGDLNSTILERPMINFCETYNLRNLIKEPTCYKNPNNPSSIDVMLTNMSKSFQSSTTLETGLSDFHKMTITVLKTFFKKRDPITINYRCYSKFNDTEFKDELLTSLQNFNKNMCYKDFNDIFMKILNSHAPVKQKVIRGNNAPFMNKTLSKAFMHRSKLKNNFNKNPTEENKQLFKKQRNFCVSLLKREKKKYYNNLDLNIFKDNKKFWQRIKPLFSNKQNTLQKHITIIDNNVTISEDAAVAENLNKFFINTVKNLDIEKFDTENITDNNAFIDNIDEIIFKYKSHPSIIKIRDNVIVNDKFQFMDVTDYDFNCLIADLDPNKAATKDDIPAKILISNNVIVSRYLCNIYNNCKKDNLFPLDLKLADVIPIHKKQAKFSMKNYRPVSLLPIISKLFERIMYNQMFLYINNHLSPYIFGYRKGHSTEHCLMVMMEMWKKALDEKKQPGAILTDLSKAFDCLNHDLLIAKLDAYGFDKNALMLVYNYLKERKQRVKVNSSYSSWTDLNSGVPQGSILGPLLFNTFINDIFYFSKNTRIANYADDNSTYTAEDDIYALLNTLEVETAQILYWFRINEMKSNDDKCHLFVANHNNMSVKIGKDTIEATDTVDLLGLTIDNKLEFNIYIQRLCKKANQKLHALARIAKYINYGKLRIIMKTFVESQFNYCPLIWMFHSRSLNHKINKIHERALRIVYKNDVLTFEELLDMDNTVTIHDRNLQRLAIEMFKVKNKLSPPLIQNLFSEQDNRHALRNNRCFEMPNARTVRYGTDTIRYRGPKTWEMLPTQLKEAKSLASFKLQIKTWKPQGCSCRLCKTYIHNLGFL